MHIILAGPRGFCAGVNMAIESLEAALGVYGTPIYVYHEIVHNRWVVERFRRQGAVFVNDLSRGPAGGAPPLFRPTASRRKSATRPPGGGCTPSTPPAPGDQGPSRSDPLRRGGVYDRSDRARRTRRGGGHDGRSPPRRCVLVESPDDVDRLEVADPEKLAYLTQTTLSLDDAARIIRRLRQRFPKIVGPPKDDICYATQNRQEAVRALSQAPTLSWWSAAGTAPTAGGWPKWHGTAACPRT